MVHRLLPEAEASLPNNSIREGGRTHRSKRTYNQGGGFRDAVVELSVQTWLMVGLGGEDRRLIERRTLLSREG